VLPTSDDLEAYHERVQSLYSRLAKYRGAEVKAAELIDALAAAAKEWVRLSTLLRAIDTVDRGALDALDIDMRDVLRMTSTRARASAYQKKLHPLVDSFVDRVVLPLIRHEGSPTQVAGRQILGAFTAPITADEAGYIEEAARCVGVRCYRASIIMLWAAAVAHLHQAVQVAGFTAFNAAAAAAAGKKGSPYNRIQKGLSISSLPELQRLREFDLIVTGMELWGYDLQNFEELERLLGIRNGAAHPGMMQPSTLDVQQFATKVNAAVFAKVLL
jgi:hypothetical protein